MIKFTVLRSKTIVDSDPVLREPENESDCLADRAVALDEQKAHLVILFIRIHFEQHLNAIFFFFYISRMVVKQAMYQNVQQMDVINGYNAIVLLVTVGVYTKILVKIFLALQLKMEDLIVHLIQRDQ